MSQPDHAPVERSARVRLGEQTPPARRWVTDRPGEALAVDVPRGAGFGSPGPDQGYGLKLVKQFAGKLKLAPDEEEIDAFSGCAAVGLKRAALFHRAPVIYDFELAFNVWGFLGDAPADLIAFRAPVFRAIAHDYAAQRSVADRVPEATLRLSPAEARARVGEWRDLLLV